MQEESKRRPIRYLALGDSYTIGESVDPEDRWPVQLARLLLSEGLDVEEPIILARTGWTTGELEAAIERAGLRGPFDFVSLLIGVNNQYRGKSEREYRTELARLLGQAVELAGGRPAGVLVLSIPDWGVTPFAEGRDRARIAGEIDRFNLIGRMECHRLGIPFLDITPISREAVQDPEMVAPDGLHPSAKMYAEWARLALFKAKAALGGM